MRLVPAVSPHALLQAGGERLRGASLRKDADYKRLHLKVQQIFEQQRRYTRARLLVNPNFNKVDFNHAAEFRADQSQNKGASSEKLRVAMKNSGA